MGFCGSGDGVDVPKVLYCRYCGKPMVLGDLKVAPPCENCKERWYGLEPISVKPVEWTLTVQDRKFLKAHRIDSEEAKETA